MNPKFPKICEWAFTLLFKVFIESLSKYQSNILKNLDHPCYALPYFKTPLGLSKPIISLKIISLKIIKLFGFSTDSGSNKDEANIKKNLTFH